MIESIKEKIEVYKMNYAQLRRAIKTMDNQNVGYYTTRQEIRTLNRVIKDLEFILNGEIRPAGH